MKKEFRLPLNVDGLISIRFPHFQSEIQRTDWLQKVKLTQHAKIAGAKLENFLAKTVCSQSVRWISENGKFDVGLVNTECNLLQCNHFNEICIELFHLSASCVWRYTDDTRYKTAKCRTFLSKVKPSDDEKNLGLSRLRVYTITWFPLFQLLFNCRLPLEGPPTFNRLGKSILFRQYLGLKMSKGQTIACKFGPERTTYYTIMQTRNPWAAHPSKIC